MKKTLIEQRKRILEIMGNVNEELLSELNVQYLNMLLDKINDTGMESLSNYEKEALQKLANDQDVNPPEVQSLGQTKSTLRFTALDPETGAPLITPDEVLQTFGDAKLKDSYIQGEAEQLAGFDVPVFLEGDLGQLDKPEEEQDIRMVLPQGEYECVSRTVDEGGSEVNAYILTLKVEEDADDYDPDLGMMNETSSDFELGEMEDYKVYKDEKDFSPEQKEKITNFVNNYKGDFEDEDIHKLADEMGLDTPEVEEFIYNMARK